MASPSYMKNVITGTIVPVPDDQTYEHLKAQREDNEPVWEQATSEQAKAAGLITNEGKTLAVTAVAAAVATVGNDLTTVVGTIEVAGTVTKAEYFPAAAQNGAATNSRTIAVKNGAKTVATLDLVAGVNLVANQSKTLPLGSGANIQVAAGDQISFTSTHVGTGIADPGGLVLVTYVAS